MSSTLLDERAVAWVQDKYINASRDYDALELILHQFPELGQHLFESECYDYSGSSEGSVALLNVLMLVGSEQVVKLAWSLCRHYKWKDVLVFQYGQIPKLGCHRADDDEGQGCGSVCRG